MENKVDKNFWTRLRDFLKVEMAADAPTVYTDSTIKISEKQVGGKVELINEDASLSPAPDGDYEMDNGDKFTVKDGVITVWNGESQAPAAPEEPAAEAAMSEQEPANEMKAEIEAQAQVIAELKDLVASIQTKFSELEGQFNGFKSQESEMSEKFNSQLSEITETLKLVAGLPAEFSKTDKRNVIKDNNNSKKDNIKAAFGL